MHGNDPVNYNIYDIKKAAADFLSQNNTELIVPVPIEEIVEIKLGIRIILIRGLIRDFGVNAFISNTFDRIVIDEVMYTKQPQRIRFTIAEEVGHLILHKDWYLQNGPKITESYLDWQEKIDGKTFDYIERQAKTFAGMILIPEPVIINRWQKYCDRNNITSPCNVFDLTDTFPELANEFDVTPDSLLVRLSIIRLIQLPDGFWKKRASRK
jgi:Zn-dependent peptidase ImmA (M78 family)